MMNGIIMCASVRKRKSQSPKRTNQRKRMEKKRRKKSLQLKKNHLLRMNLRRKTCCPIVSSSMQLDAVSAALIRTSSFCHSRSSATTPRRGSNLFASSGSFSGSPSKFECIDFGTKYSMKGHRRTSRSEHKWEELSNLMVLKFNLRGVVIPKLLI